MYTIDGSLRRSIGDVAKAIAQAIDHANCFVNYILLNAKIVHEVRQHLETSFKMLLIKVVFGWEIKLKKCGSSRNTAFQIYSRGSKREAHHGKNDRNRKVY